MESRARNILSLFIVFLLVTTVIFSLLIVRTLDVIESKYIEENKHLAKVSSESLASFFRQYETLLDVVSYQLRHSASPMNLYEQRSYLTIMQVQMPHISAIGLVEPEGQLLLSTGVDPSIELPNLLELPSSRDSFQQALDSYSMVIGRSYFSQSLDQYIVPLRKAYRNSQGELFFVITATVQLDRAFEFFRNDESHEFYLFRESDHYFQLTGDRTGTDYSILDQPADPSFSDSWKGMIQEDYGTSMEDFMESGHLSTVIYPYQGGQTLSTFTYLKDYQLWLMVDLDRSIYRREQARPLLGMILGYITLNLFFFFYARNVHKSEIKEKDQLNNYLFETQKLKEQLSSVLNSMNSIILLVDQDLNIILSNDFAQEKGMCQDCTDPSIGLQICFPQLIDHISIIEESMNSGNIRNRKLIYSKNDGEVHEDLWIFPLRSDLTMGAVIRLDDITRDYHLMQELNMDRKMEAIGQLAGGVAHDFNNMLSGILSATDLLLLPDSTLSDEARRYVDLIAMAALRAADLTDKLLTFSRKGNISISSVNIHECIDDSLTIISRTLDKKVKIHMNLKAQKPMVLGDKTGMQNILINLAINAAHAMPNGGSITIETENIQLDEKHCSKSSFTLYPGEFVELHVRDQGVGISKEHLEKIFEPFFTTKDVGKGTGLGLSAVYGTIQSYHGEIYVESQVDLGTSFIMRIPCNPPPQS